MFWIIDADCKRSKSLFEQILTLWSAIPELEEAAKLLILDSYDWSIFRSGSVLYHTDTSLYFEPEGLAEPVSERDIKELDLASLSKPFRSRISTLLSDWKLLKKVGLIQKRKILLLRNGDLKGICRFERISFSLFFEGGGKEEEDREQKSRKSSDPLSEIWRLTPLRGYEDETWEVIQFLSSTLTPLEEESPVRLTLGKIIDLGEEELPVQDDEDIAPTVFSMIVHRLRLARSYERGIIEDIDPECLHQYRVNLRKVRSLLSLTKELFPEEKERYLRAELAEIMKATNTLRDLDVHALEEQWYKSTVADRFRPALSHLFSQLLDRRSEEAARLSGILSSREYEERIEALCSLLEERPPLTGVKNQDGEWDVYSYVQKRFNTLLQRIEKKAKPIGKKSPDRKIHQLRVMFKKIRYLIDFFKPLFSGKAYRKIKEEIRRCQNILGEFNNLSVQLTFMEGQMESVGKHADAPELLPALGAIIQELNKRKKMMKDLSITQIEHFSSVSSGEKNRKGRMK